MAAVHRFLLCLAVLACALGCGAQTPSYTTIVVFGDSLSDTGNDASISAALYTVNAQVPGPATDYTLGRFTDGTDTVPAAHNYNGVWIEQLAAMFGTKPAVLYSLAGGSNHAYGFATTNTGNSVFTYGPGNIFAFSVENMQQQVADYLATKPVITSSTLFVVWGGANDLIAATSSSDILNAAARDVGIVQTLISAGATNIIVPNLPPLGLVPRFNGSPTTSAPSTAAAQAFDQALAAYLAAIPAANPGKTLRLYPLDTYTLFNSIVANPAQYGFANVTASAQGNSSINPDTYLFWDDLHPTTYGHSLIAAQANTLLSGPFATSLGLTSTISNANLGAAVTFTAKVSTPSGAPLGTVSFYDGTTLIGSAIPSGGSTTVTATLSTSALTAGTHSISATFTGVNGFGNSTGSVSQTVTAPALTSSLQPTSLLIADGSQGTVSFIAQPVGGFTGSATFACSGLPAHMGCSFSPSTGALAGNVAFTTMLTVSTNASSSALQLPTRQRTSRLSIYAGGFSLAGILLLLSFRRARTRVPAKLLLLLLSATAVAALGGCGNSNDAAHGVYSVTVSVSAGGVTSSQPLVIAVQ